MGFECNDERARCPRCGKELKTPIPNLCSDCGFPLGQLDEELQKVEETMLGIDDCRIRFHDSLDSSVDFALFFRLVSRDVTGAPLLRPHIRISWNKRCDLLHEFSDDEVGRLRDLCDWICAGRVVTPRALVVDSGSCSLSIIALQMSYGETLTPFLENAEDFEFDRGLGIEIDDEEIEITWNRGFAKNLVKLGHALDNYYEILRKTLSGYSTDVYGEGKDPIESAPPIWSSPVYDKDSGIIKYGLYPQTRVSDPDIISFLKKSYPELNGWYFYNGCYYVRCAAELYGTDGLFDDGSEMVEGDEYWFRCEPIEWVVIAELDGKYKAISKRPLEVCCFDSTSNDYADSEIRAWLNEGFYQKAFPPNEPFIQETLVDNSASTTHSPVNDFACENTADKICLMSYKEYKESLLLANCPWEQIKCTDWAKANGAESCGTVCCWTRSPDGRDAALVSAVENALHCCVAFVFQERHSVRPVIALKIR